jgi:dienelactone hydrolase
MRLTSFLTLSLMTAAPALAADVSYTVDGENFTGYWAEADNPKGVVLIVHDWDGMTDYERQRADMPAEMGYNAFALDMFGNDTRPKQSITGWQRRERSTRTGSG